jgi:hypothetical protein
VLRARTLQLLLLLLLLLLVLLLLVLLLLLLLVLLLRLWWDERLRFCLLCLGPFPFLVLSLSSRQRLHRSWFGLLLLLLLLVLRWRYWDLACMRRLL